MPNPALGEFVGLGDAVFSDFNFDFNFAILVLELNIGIARLGLMNTIQADMELDG